MSDNPPVLSARSVGKRYGGLTALRDVSFDLRLAEVCGLIGPNGSGKTTLFDIISGLVAASMGTVVFDGSVIDRLLPEQRARAGLRRTFQRPQLYGRLTVADNVLTALEWHGGGGGMMADLLGLRARRRREAARRDRARLALEQCGIAHLADRPAGTLPVGQARFVELARAVVDEPRVLLLDEPTSGLSGDETATFGEQIDRMRGAGCAVLLVEHDVGFVMHHCDRVIVLNLGEVLAEGTPGEVKAHAAVRSAYLG